MITVMARSALGLDLLVGAALLLDVGADDGGALLGPSQGGGPSDPLVGAGDDSDLAVESHESSIPEQGPRLNELARLDCRRLQLVGYKLSAHKVIGLHRIGKGVAVMATGDVPSTEVVVVGGGIAGASLAYALAGAGLGRDRAGERRRVPGPGAWGEHAGVGRARGPGRSASRTFCSTPVPTSPPLWKQYDEGGGSRPTSRWIDGPGVPGSLNLRHPAACQALARRRGGGGCDVVRGVRDVKLSAGSSPSVTYAVDGRTAR